MFEGLLDSQINQSLTQGVSSFLAVNQNSSFEPWGWRKPAWSLGELQWDVGLQSQDRAWLLVTTNVLSSAPLMCWDTGFLVSMIQLSLCCENSDIKWKVLGQALPTAWTWSNYFVYWAFVSSSIVSRIKYCVACLDEVFWKVFWTWSKCNISLWCYQLCFSITSSHHSSCLRFLCVLLGRKVKVSAYEKRQRSTEKKPIFTQFDN